MSSNNTIANAVNDSTKQIAKIEDLVETASGRQAAKRTRSSSGTRGISNEDILKAIRSSEERIVSEMRTLLDSRIAEVRSEFDDKLNALSSSIDGRIRAVLEISNVGSNDGKYEDVVSSIDAAAAISNTRIESLERAHYLSDVIINGIPVLEKENAFSYFRSICDVISFQCGVSAVSSVFRLPTRSTATNAPASSAGHVNVHKTSGPPIVVKFLNSDLSRQFISCYLKFKHLNLTHIGYSTPTRIFINENLTKSNRELFRYCLQLKHRHKSYLLQLFTRHGIVYVKLAGSDKPVIVLSKKEIDNIITKLIV